MWSSAVYRRGYSDLLPLLRLQERRLVLGQHLHLVLVDRLPVVLQHTAGVTRVRVPGPVGVADLVLLEVVHQGVLPDGLGALTGGLLTTELTEQQRGDVLLLDVRPVLLPDGRHVLREVLRHEPVLVVD